MRHFGLIGDVHAHDRNLAQALGLFATRNVDRVLCVGDIVDGIGNVERCVALLKGVGATVVSGNHERWLLADTMRRLPNTQLRGELSRATLAFLRALPRTCRIDTAGGPLLLCHGIGDDDMACLKPWDEGYALECLDALHELRRGEYHWVVGGHSHVPMDRSFGELRFVNPGQTAPAPFASIAILDVVSRTAEFFRIGEAGAEPVELEALQSLFWR